MDIRFLRMCGSHFFSQHVGLTRWNLHTLRDTLYLMHEIIIVNNTRLLLGLK